MVFPEGSTSVDGPRRGQSNFFAGAFRIARMESAPIELVFIDYREIERCAWLGKDEFVPHLWKLYAPEGIHVKLRTQIIETVHDRRHQRSIHQYSRNWILEGGRSATGLATSSPF